MKNKVVFFDIDGTLYNHNVGVPDSAKEAIHMLKENGHIPVICTGRTKPAIDIISEVISLPFSGVIGGAGTYVEYENQVVESALLSEAVLDQVLFLLKKMKANFILEGPEYLYYDKQLLEEEWRGWEVFKRKKEILQQYQKGTSRVHKLFVDSYEQSIFATIRPEFEKIIEIVQYEDQIALEMICKGYSKAEGIRILTEKLGVAKEDTYAFGDGPNDLEMLAYVEYGIAMGNSEQQVLAQAKYTTANMEEDGIYKGLKEFGLI